MLLDLERHIIGDRRQARNRIAQPQLFQRFAHLLGQKRGERRRPLPVKQRFDARHGMQRLIGRHGGDQVRDDLAARLGIVGQALPQPSDCVQLPGGDIENVFVDEALARERTMECEHGTVTDTTGGGAEQDDAQRRQQPLKLDIAHRHGFEHHLQQLVLRHRRLAGRPGPPP